MRRALSINGDLIRLTPDLDSDRLPRECFRPPRSSPETRRLASWHGIRLAAVGPAPSALTITLISTGSLPRSTSCLRSLSPRAVAELIPGKSFSRGAIRTQKRRAAKGAQSAGSSKAKICLASSQEVGIEAAGSSGPNTKMGRAAARPDSRRPPGCRTAVGHPRSGAWSRRCGTAVVYAALPLGAASERIEHG